MKIAHCAPLFLPTIGGAEVFVHNLALHQARSGHDVGVVVPWSAWRAVRGRVPYRVLPLLPRTMAVGLAGGWSAASLQLAGYHLRHRFDVWHIETAFPGAPLAAAFLERRRPPSILTGQGADVQTLPSVGYGYRLERRTERLIAASLRPLDRIVAISESMRTDFLDLGVEADRIQVIPNGVDVGRIEAFPIDRPAVRQSLGVPPQSWLLLTVGRAHPKKGFALIPQIARRLREQHGLEFVWLLVGRGMDPIVSAARDLDVGDRVRAVPQIGIDPSLPREASWSLPSETLIRLYKAADAFVFPSLIEGFGIVLAEALAAGLPIVTTDAPGCRDIVQDGVNGLLSPRGAAPAMADRIAALLTERALQGRLRQGARTTSWRYDWSRIGRRYEATYEEVIRGRVALGRG